MDFWNRARSFAEEATKRSQELAAGAPKLSDIVSETAKRSKEIAAEASKRADQIRSEALKRADDIKHLAYGIAPSGAGTLAESPEEAPAEKELEIFGITEELREFVQGITAITFRDFPLEDDTQLYDVPSVSNVRQDLSEWQAKHANLVLLTVKEISQLRYELCPRFMKERKFWRIYFIIVNNHVAPYEKRYMEDIKINSAEQVKDDKVEEPSKVEIISKEEVKEAYQQSETSTSSSTEKDLEQYVEDTKLNSAEQVKDDKVEESSKVEIISKEEVKKAYQQSKTSISSSTEKDLDVFLLGEGGDSDDGPDDVDEDFDDDFDKFMDDMGDDEKDDL
ncbi:hypothetical protein UlMin_043958 [Ulmus minor]